MISIYHTKKIGRLAIAEYFWFLIFLSTLLVQIVETSVKSNPNSHFEDDEFAEFEEFDDEIDQQKRQHPSKSSSASDDQDKASGSTEKPPLSSNNDEQSNVKQDRPKPKVVQKHSDEDVVDELDDLEGIVEDEIEDEYSHLKDEAEFENFDRDKAARQGATPGGDKSGGPNQPQQLRFTDVPNHLRNNWSNFQVELLMLMGLGLYLLTYAYGKSKNYRLATFWFDTNREILQSNFEVVGDDGTTQEVQQNVLMKESDSSYNLWCTGRQGCQGMLVQLKFLKRQDIVSMVMQLFKPKYDKVVVKVILNSDETDPYVLALGNKKSVAKLAKDMNDLCQFCTEKKNADKLGLPEEFAVFAEIAEATGSILDTKSLSVIKKFEESFDYVHISDQFSGTKPTEGDTQSKLPDTSRVIIFSFNVPNKLSASEKDIDEMKPLMNLVFHTLDKVRRFKLSREAKQKTEKNRLAAQESYLKQTHAQRQEAAQQRREDKVRERKEKLLAEEDPEKQKRLEKMEAKRELKKKQPKVKQLKIKAG